MLARLSRASRFLLERWIQQGVPSQLLLMAALIALVSLVGGLVAWAATPGFASPSEAIWWAFLRLTDPGYLGDDAGAVLRVISTMITILGYVIFMGSLIAIMTQWLALTLRKLESGLTPISMKHHVVILGWTNRTPEIVLKLLAARGRLQRFLARRATGKLRIVILSDQVGAERRLELRDHLGVHWNESQVFLRSGSSQQLDHLKRLDLGRAAAVLVPGADFELGGAESTDTRVIKTLLTVASLLRAQEQGERPHVVAEIFDPLKVSLARSAVGERIEVISSDHVISRLLSQSLRHRGLAQVLLGILSHRQGNSLYLRKFPEFAGLVPHALHGAFPRAIVLGFVRADDENRRIDLDPHSQTTLEQGDFLVLLAESFERCAPLALRPQTPPPARLALPPRRAQARVHRILALGWSYKIGALAVELDESLAGRFELTVMSRVATAERERWLERVVFSRERVRIEHLEGDYGMERDLAKLDLSSFDNVVFLAGGLAASGEEADARTILGYVLLRAALKGVPRPPEILVELLDPDNSHLFDESQDVCLVTPRVLSHLLAHVTLRPELNAVFDELFCAGGYEIELWAASELELSGTNVTFPEIQARALEHGVIALGVVRATHGVELNPEREKSFALGEADQLVVLAG